ncbi:MAG: hypothetical protein EBU90_01405 [Proteobacteria bacterium]|nr:hypothetical protein [Pseudomonadota bacterium]
MNFSKDKQNKHRTWHTTQNGKYCVDMQHLVVRFYPKSQIILQASSADVFKEYIEDSITKHTERFSSNVITKETKSVSAQFDWKRLNPFKKYGLK